MNWKQKIALWVGILIFLFFGLFCAFEDLELEPLLVLWAMVIVLTGGLIVTFKGKPSKHHTEKTKDTPDDLSGDN